jgi:hypothetical protein
VAWVVAALALLSGLPAAATAQQSEPAIAPERIEAALYRYRHEPSVERVVRAALRTRAYDPGRARDAMDRARVSGLLPNLRARVRRGQAVDLRALGLGGDAERTNLYQDDDLMLEGTAIFHLDRLLFAPQEVGLMRELRALEQARAELVRAVVSLYFERRRMQLERDLLGRTDLARAIRILETEALLNTFTDGAFARMMGARQREPTPR